MPIGQYITILDFIFITETFGIIKHSDGRASDLARDIITRLIIYRERFLQKILYFLHLWLEFLCLYAT